MANTTSIQILNDGPRNVVVKFDGLLDTSELGTTTIVDPALLSDMNINGVKASKLRINKIVYDIEDTLDLELFWDAATPVRIWNLVGRGKVDMHRTGGINNNAVNPTGKITASTQGWAAGTILSFSVVLELVKQ